MQRSSAQSIPGFYRVFFTIFDPLFALGVAYMNCAEPGSIVTSLFPEDGPWSTVTPSHMMLFHQSAGALVCLATCMGVMLRYAEDVRVWRIFEFAVLFTDFPVFYGNCVALDAQQRLSLDKIRPEEWNVFAITAFVATVRILFVAGVGLGKGTNTKKNA
ncbi:hypothetical protein BS50DRAFT_583013 [Corynespora cassiicola Philippines]|uniref:DUF7704 domain-containing protein n=1 Tax=Corynespora cassiicola Philippines TaxID=1448308 RepID=A0A2T2P725_CORCC|nr:hypothetical protein BS50DRAFT_583013 [Corynespora cassiicola Philippines]